MSLYTLEQRILNDQIMFYYKDSLLFKNPFKNETSRDFY